MAAGVGILLVGLASSGTGQQLPVRIPQVAGMTFAGEPVRLPDGLKGTAGVLILGFSQGSRDQVAAWGRRLAADAKRPGELMYYEMPMLAGVPGLLRGWVLKQIKKSVSENGQRHFLPVQDHEEDWKRVVGFGNADDAYVVVVDGDGMVQARVQGAVTDAGFAAVERKASEILAGK